MRKRVVVGVLLALSFALAGCSVVRATGTVVGVGVGVASTGAHVAVGATVRAADLVIPDGKSCDEDSDEAAADDDEDCGAED